MQGILTEKLAHMNFGRDRKVFGIVAQNSAGYVREVFEHLHAGDVVVNLRHASDLERMQAAEVQEVVVPPGGTGWVGPFTYAGSSDVGIAQVLFSSGTEGKSKAVVLSHAALANTTDRLISAMELTSDVREYLGVPAFYSFGFARCRVVSRLGGRLYIPPSGFDPIEIADLLSRNELNAISAVPSLWRLLMQNRELYRNCGDRVRWIEIGSQYMSGEEKTLLKSVFPQAKIVQHYGLTEASRSTFLKLHEVTGQKLESVGQASDGVEVEIDGAGRIRIRGPHLASGTLVAGEILPLTDKAGWLTTGDLGRIEDGFLYYEGRADDQINCGGVKLSPDAVERDLYADLGLSAGLCVSKAADDLRGEVVLIAYLEALDAQALRNAAGRVLREYGLEAGNSVRLLRIASIPVTQTGKPQRRTITRQYEEERLQGIAEPVARQSQAQPALEHSDDQMSAIVKIWEDVLRISPVSVHDSFFDLGGDSLSALSVAMKMESLGIPHHITRQIFEGKSIAEIVKRDPAATGRTPLAVASRTIDAVRGMLVLFVIASHWMPGVVKRLPEYFAVYNSYLSPFYSAGTPGFAIIFGVGIGFALMPRFLRSAQSVNTLVFRNALLLGVGISCIAATKIAAALVAGNSMTPVAVSNTFWGVLTYYLVAVLSIPVWLRWLSRRDNLPISCLGAAIAMFLAHMLVEAYPPDPSANPFVQTGILLITAKFNYFNMTAGVMLGIAAGGWLRTLVASGQVMAKTWPIGGLLMAFSLLLSAQMGQLDLWFTWPKPLLLWLWFCYAGFVLIMISVVYRIVTAERSQVVFDMPLKVLSIVGVVAFPLYIGSEMVIPFKDFLEVLRVPAALPVSLLLFFAASVYLMTRLYRVYFSKVPASAADLGIAEFLVDRKAE